MQDVPAALGVAPTVVRLIGKQSDATVETDLLVWNSGGRGSLSFAPTVLDSGGLPVEVTPQNAQVGLDESAFVHVKVSTSGVAPGSYRALLRLYSGSGPLDIPLSVLIAAPRAVMGLSFNGTRFDVREGNGYSEPQSAAVLNTGPPGSVVNWRAELVTGDTWLTLGSPTGSSTVDAPGAFSLSMNANAAALPAGSYYALIKVSDPQALNSPQFLVAVLNLSSATVQPQPDPVPAGLFFTGAAGGPQPGPQQVQVFTSSAAPVPFQAAVSTADGGSWLLVNAAAAISGRTSTANPTTLNVTVNTAGLKPGSYAGDVNVAVGGSVRTTNISLVVQPSTTIGRSSSAAAKPRANGACTPSRLSLLECGLVNNFQVPAGWPTQLVVRLNDDCGNTVLNARVVAVFDNGDPPQTMQLIDSQSGFYATTWAPANAGSQVAIGATANAPNLQPASVLISGKVTANSVPALSANSVLSTLNPVVGAPLAPGGAVQIFGSGLAATAVSTDVIPLPSTFNQTTVIVGGIAAPLYYLSNGQVNAQLPMQLTPGQQYQVVVSANGALTLPDTINVVPVSPGLASFPDSNIIAQHADFTLVDASHPAVPGETVLLYLVGMGVTTPWMNEGAAGPQAEPLARVAVQPTVTIDRQPSMVWYAGLAPGGVGDYQINCVVPSGIHSGLVDVVVTQNGVASNIARLPVR
jgi:uncharacterized protein (TIGR03437 family)